MIGPTAIRRSPEAAKLRARSFTLDGEAVVSGPDGIAVFEALHRRRKVTDAMFYAFDLLELNGKDLRLLPLGERKAKLARLLADSAAGIVFNDHTDEDGPTVFEHACRFGLEGIVSQRLSALYRSRHALAERSLPRRRVLGSSHQCPNEPGPTRRQLSKVFPILRPHCDLRVAYRQKSLNWLGAGSV
jgi:hypothetical protein